MSFLSPKTHRGSPTIFARGSGYPQKGQIMKISEYSVTLNSKNSYSERKNSGYFSNVLADSLETDTDNRAAEKEEKSGTNGSSYNGFFRQSSFENRFRLSATSSSTLSGRKESLSQMMESLRLQMVDYFMKWLFGDDYEERLGASDLAAGYTSSGYAASGYVVSGYMESYSETEATSFSGTGTVTDSTGRTIEFAMNFTLSRSFSAYASTITSTRTVLTDPLILNFDGDLTDFSNQNFYFDLDCDGVEEEVTGLGEGSAFLAMDKNDDGKINDGSELFGTESGNGFEDLAEYDEDGNGWIDENDSAFDRLRVFSVDSEGNRTLLSLKESGVGAIYTGSAETDYHVTGSTADNAIAKITRSGVFLYENGGVGNVIQADLAVYA